MTFSVPNSDCDNFAMAEAGWLASKGLGNSAAKMIEVRSDNAVHMTLVAVTTDHEVIYSEPQNGKLYELDALPVTLTGVNHVMFEWI